MKTRTFNLISFIISLIFAASLIYFAAGVIKDKKNGSSRAQEIFSELTEKTNTAANLYSADSYNFSQSFIESAGDFSDYKKLTLSVDGKAVYSYDSIHSSSKNVKSFNSRIQNKNGQNLLIEAQIFTTRPDSFFFYARTTFIVIFIATIAAILILIFSKPEPQTLKDETDFADDEDKIIFEDKDIQEQDFSKLESSTKEGEKEAEELNLQENIEEVKEQNVQEDVEEFLDKKDLKTSEEQNEVLPIEEEAGNAEIKENTEAGAEEGSNENEEIQSAPDFNAVFEERLLESTQKNEDISVLVLKEESENNSTEEIHKIFDTVFDDNADIFEYKDRLFLILLCNTNLDEALIPAKKLYSALTEKSGNATVTIGLSARNMRKISTERLLTEAVEAQKHAALDPLSPIIAFRASPEKYNSLILNR